MADSAVTLVDTLAAGRTLTMADIAADPLLSPEESAAYAWLGIATLCSLPLLEGSRFAANLNVYACRPRRRTDNAIGLVEEVPTGPGGGRACRAENARRDSEEQLRTVADTAPASDRRPGVPPDHRVGEIALLRAIPRTATVIAHNVATVYELNREPFLTAVLGHAPTLRQADRIADARLAAGAASGERDSSGTATAEEG